MNIEFTHPLYVSSEGHDLLKIIVNENTFFISAEHDKPIKSKFKVEVKVPPQARSEEDANLIENIGAGARLGVIFSLAIPFGFMLFMSVSMDTVWGFYNMLQILGNEHYIK